ncbi:TPA: hypothetical protein NNQ18_004594 [Salmonella enterica]|nr:hypothetical protein [Salmonella enterica]HCH9056052.1 hypothetical protein [Salmonella enterica]
MKTIKCVDNGVYFSWLINTENRWCGFQIQKYFYDDGVVLEEYNEDSEIIDTYVLDMFPKNLSRILTKRKIKSLLSLLRVNNFP